MTTLFKVSVSTCVSLAALAVAAVVSPAQAEDVHIYLADLNLQSSQGQAGFDARVAAAAREICAGTERLKDATHSSCIQAVREEARDNLKQEMERIARKDQVKVASARRR